MKRKDCRRDVKATLKVVGWLEPTTGVMSGPDVTRRFLAAKCLTCARCPSMVERFAPWADVLPQDMAMPPLRVAPDG